MRTLLASRSAVLASVGLLGAGAALAGCQADYAADITNKTSLPVMATIFRRSDHGAVLGAARRLGPGDRGFVGVVHTDKGRGAYLQIDIMPNPTRPVTMELPPGQSYLELEQEGEGPGSPLRVLIKP